RLERLLEACREPSTAVDCLPVLYRRPLSGFHLFLALGEAVAHLEYLALAGSLSRLADERGLIRYVRGR
ncbi:MAG: MBL fold metallo-hydrolase, partial [Steroidobacteraceae bacterium]